MANDNRPPVTAAANDLNEQIVKVLLDWKSQRGDLSRSPAAFQTADRLIAMVRDHDRTHDRTHDRAHDRAHAGPQPGPQPGIPAQAVSAALQAIRTYMNAVDAMVQAIRQAGIPMAAETDPAAIRREADRLLEIINGAEPAGSAQQTRATRSRKRTRPTTEHSG